MQQAEDFRQEAFALAAILEPLSAAQFASKTQFKNWTIEDVLGHLHIFNQAANLSLQSGGAFVEFYEPIRAALAGGRSMLETQYDWLNGLGGRALFDAWLDLSEQTADNFSNTDPKARLKWAGPDMSARSFITARQMETWAHGHEIYDVMGLQREDTDRVKNIDHMGVIAYGWTFINRKLDVPEPAPYVRLVAPSGAVWEWNEPQDGNRVGGSATEFAQVVTQVRNVADTALSTQGENAGRWLAFAQCFAGKPEDPPSPGTRFLQPAP
ncbi:MAG: TIGR03084 family protein [Alphaproteobacteria bacterium]|nr:TIGR03084 family protein [Alphaproteobacteria bacterium]